ncbi:MAG TPA: sigma-70 family RNA polymerase sigma factor [Gemmatimonadales bacterium]|nr:sigma-70 family RNA polymerase sigma factor [Gemmatimonadales bacterium]
MTTDQRRTPPPSTAHNVSRADVALDPDAALLRRMADGDESALAALYDRWVDRVHTVAYWILKDADEAEDVVEETFWQAWRTAARYDGARSAASTWLVMIARSRALDRLRAHRRTAIWTAAPSTAGALLDEAMDRESGTTALPERGEHSAALVEAIGALPSEQRQALELAFFGGLSHSEIAAQTAQPLGTVKTRIRLAMEKLRQRLGFLRDEML